MRHDHGQFSAGSAYTPSAGERVEQFMPLVRKLAWHLAGSAGPTVDVDDLMQAGMVALSECVRRHGDQGDDGFAAYARLRVRGAMIDLLRAASPEPRGARARRRAMEAVRDKLAGRLGRTPGAEELACEMGLTLEEWRAREAELAEMRVESLDDHFAESDMAFASETPNAEQALLQTEDRSRLIAAIGALDDRHQTVIQLYFVEELNLAEIAQVLGVSIPRVHQIKAAALERLRKALSAG